jgi:tetratricopeptide (TPR) repeat protein
MWRTVLSLNLFLNLFLSINYAASQQIIDQLEKNYFDYRFEEVQKSLPEAIRQYPDQPTVIFLQGVFAPNADNAFQFYERVFEKYRDSHFADQSLFKIAQYYYVRQKYDLAFKYFSYLVRRYPSTKLKDEAQYLMCQCLLCQGKLDSARVFFHAFIKNAPRSPYADLAVMDMESSDSWKDKIDSKQVEKTNLPGSIYAYSLQIGAFSNQSNAEHLQSEYQAKGFDVQVVKINRESAQYFAVWVGKFETEALAKNFAVKYKDVLNNCAVVSRQ